MQPLYGKFRGKVIKNEDPQKLGRLLVQVPAVSDENLSWALPCVPYAGKKVGFFAMPPIGANVWVEFESGDPNYPIWTGCFWGQGEIPVSPGKPDTKMWKTDNVTIRMDDAKRELEFEVKLESPPNKFRILVDPKAIKLDCGPATVTLKTDQVEVKTNPAQVLVKADSVLIKNGTASVKVALAAIDAKNGAASLQVAPAAIGLKNGAASVDLSPASVSLNKGALEVI